MELSSELIGNRIRTIRIKNRISQEELADICGINKGTLSKLENGERDPSVKTILRLARGLNVPISDILELHLDYFEGLTDELLVGELLKYLKKLDWAEQNIILEMVRNFVRLKRKEVCPNCFGANNEKAPDFY